MKENTINTTQMNGEYGNASFAHGQVEFEGEAAGAVGRLFKLPKSSKIFGMRVVSDGLGGTATVAVRVTYKDGTQATIKAAAAASSAGSSSMNEAPFTLAQDGTIELLTAASAATGTIDVVCEYEYRGA